ncbi:MAG: succinate dehydrogenase assembly factor 2 [Hydrogenophilaceae bacterium]|nr:succinate dehydrogenase assembly factor 2 [Hydrogenophilaceae bacterium]
MEEEGCKTLQKASLRRLRWRCRRGLLELDVWLQGFAAARLETLTASQCAILEAILGEADADILAWLDGRQPVPVAYEQMIADMRAAV